MHVLVIKRDRRLKAPAAKGTLERAIVAQAHEGTLPLSSKHLIGHRSLRGRGYLEWVP